MMQKYYFLLVLVFQLGLVSAQNKSGKVTYGVKVLMRKVDTSGSLKKKKIRLKHARNLNEIAPYVSCVLEFNKNKAHFYSPEGMANDNGIDISKFKMASRSKGSYYINLNEKSSIHQKKSYGKLWRITTKLDSLQWTIKKDTKIIQGYRCRKATAKIHLTSEADATVIAWFAPELPFQFGPLGFGNLPGLILGFEEFLFYFEAKKINFSEKTVEIDLLEDGKLLTQAEYWKAIEKLSPY